MNVKKYVAPNGALFFVLMRLQRCRAYGAKGGFIEMFFRLIKIIIPLAVMTLFLFGQSLSSYFGIFHEFQEVLLSVEWVLLVCLTVWCGSFIFLMFSWKDLPLIGLLLIAIAAYFISHSATSQVTDAIILLAGVTLGRGTRALLNEEVRMKKSEGRNQSTLTPSLSHPMGEGENNPAHVTRHPSLVTFLVGLVVLLAFSSWWHLDMAGAYHGPRWMGLWDNPNIYGMLMGAGVVLAIGLLAENLKSEKLKVEIEKRESGVRSQKQSENEKSEIRNRKLVRVSLRRLLPIILLIAAGMMAVGLFFSYSRGAWVGTAVGLLYLAKVHGKLKWRSLKIFLFSAFCFLLLIICFFWHNTADTDAWYLKRLDLSRPSAQHRVSAWRGALQMMRDHPLGVGWNRAVGVYDKDYSPPEGGAAAITMNSYLMLGTELGLPGLVCFVGYVALCFKRKCSHLTLPHPQPLSTAGQHLIRPAATFSPSDAEKGIIMSPVTRHLSLQTACRAGAIMLLVAFWFDGGLFTLATASVFWILLELGSERQKQKTEILKAETNLSLLTSSPTNTNESAHC